jgi:hypothetical protein
MTRALSDVAVQPAKSLFMLLTVASLLPAVDAQITVVDLIPQTWSNEAHQDCEPNIAVNPANPLQIACSTFTLDTPSGATMSGSVAPLFVSDDGGNTWSINKIIPSAKGKTLPTQDITLRFGGKSGVLYGAILRQADNEFNPPLNLLRTNNFMGPEPMTVLLTRDNEDQPYVEAMTIATGVDAGKDRVYVGHNNGSNAIAAIDLSLDAATSAPPDGFSLLPIIIETRNTSRDGPQVRLAIHPTGIVYGVFYGWRSGDPPVFTADVVVVRDDSGGKSSKPFQDLSDSDGLPGKRVVTGISVPWLNEHLKDFGQERLGGDLAIAVDPNDSKRVFIAYSDGTSATDYTLRIRSSTDGGLNWSTDLQTLSKAKNPGLAINSSGTVGLLYQQVTENDTGQRWITHFVRTTDGFAHVSDAVLADSDASLPTADTSVGPYLGDYEHLLSVQNNFFGIFCTSNEAKFPSGITLKRNVDSKTKHMRNLQNTADVPPSIDPFFFKVIETTNSSH